MDYLKNLRKPVFLYSSYYKAGIMKACVFNKRNCVGDFFFKLL